MRINRADARRSLDANSDRTAFRESDVTLRSAVTVTVPAEAVSLRTRRLPHHRMMSGNVWEGWKLSYYGRCSRISLERSRVAQGQGSKCNRKTVAYTRYRPTARVLSTVLIPSIRVVVMVIEKPGKNDASGPRHARFTLIREYAPPVPRSVSNSISQRKMCAPRSIFGKYHTYHTNIYLIYIGNGCNFMHQVTNVRRQHAPTADRQGGLGDAHADF